MKTLSQKYDNKETRDGIKVNKTYLAPLSQLYIEPGYNIREIDPEHVENFAHAYATNPDMVPALFIEVTDQGLKINEGHHRFLGAKLAVERGANITSLECKDVTGQSDAKKLTLMINSSQGKSLSPIARGNGYRRYKSWGWTNDEIAAEVGRSVSDVQLHLSLVSMPEDIQKKVEDNKISYANAAKIVREHGDKAIEVIEAAEQQAEQRKVTAKLLDKRKFSQKRAMRVVELVAQSSRSDLEQAELDELIDEYRSTLKETE